jgi:hypothetical protein
MKTLEIFIKIKQKGEKLFVFIKENGKEFSLFFIKNIREKQLMKLSKAQKFIDWAQKFSEEIVKKIIYALYEHILKNHTENEFVFEFSYSE